MALDAASQAFMEQAAAAGGKPLQDCSPEEARATGAAMVAMFGEGPAMADVGDRELVGKDGEKFSVRILRPTPRPTGIIVYYHGGGWVTGDIDMFDTLGRQLAERTNCAVVLVNYRKAPENPYPVPVEDAWTALQWADEHKAELAAADVALIVAGDSAGGNLAAVMALRARDHQGPDLAAQVLACPVTDHDFTRASYLSGTAQQILTSEGMVWFFDHYVPDSFRHMQEVSPMRAASLADLPPTIIFTAVHDPLHDEGVAYADALQAAGNDVIFKDFEDQMHDFWMMVGVLPAAADALTFVVDSLESHLATPAQR